MTRPRILCSAAAHTFAAALLAAAATPALAASLDVEIDGLASAEGTVMVALYASADRFMKVPFRTRALEPQPGGSTLRFDDLPPGDYAIAAFHDLNRNGRLDTSVFGIPTEPFGFSGIAARRGPPEWPQARFAVTVSDVRVRIKLDR